MNYQFGGRLHSESAERLHTSPSRHSDSRPRFQRNSPHSNRTSPSRSSEDSPVSQKFIKFSKISRVQLDPDEFFQGFSSEFVKKEEEEDAESLRKYSRSRENSLVQLKSLEKKLSRREAEFEEVKKENSRLREALDKEIEKRRQVEKNLKNNTIMLSELQRKCREGDITLSNLAREVRFLEDKRYSKEDKLQFSFREKGLVEEINRLRAVHIANSSLQFLERENRRLARENEEIRAENNYLRIGQRTITNRLIHFQKQLKVAIKLEEEFFELRHKYEELSKKQRVERKELERLKQRVQNEELSGKGDSLSSKGESLTYSSSSNNSITARNFARAIKYHPSRRPNGS